MTPSRTWRSLNGLIMPCSCAMRRIQRSLLIAMRFSVLLGGTGMVEQSSCTGATKKSSYTRNYWIDNLCRSPILSMSYALTILRSRPVIKLDIINEVVNKTGITKTKAELAVETVFESMKKSLAQGERIELRGFGVFNVRPRKTGIGRNPRTGAEVNIPPGKAVRFKPGKELQSID